VGVLNDVRVAQMKSSLGGSQGGQPSSTGLVAAAPPQLYTSQVLCTAITPERVEWIRKADIKQDLVPAVSSSASSCSASSASSASSAQQQQCGHRNQQGAAPGPTLVPS
jgi:hypothetical protein